MEKVSVVSPLGGETLPWTAGAARLGALNGRTICEVWNGVFKGDLSFPAIREQLTARYPELRIVPYTEFPHATGSDNPTQQRQYAEHVAALARSMGCDAIISGNGA